MMHWGPGFGWGGMGWGGMIFGGFMMLLFWGALIVLAILAFRALARAGGSHSTNVNRSVARREDNALAILKERYARGEIDKELYERMRSDLLA